jgi:hypothetical protein
MAQTNLDPNRVIQSLSLQLAQANLENTMLRMELDDANAVIAKIGAKSDETAPAADGT